MERLVYSVLSLVVGINLGSFFNVLIWRIPRRESITRPPSHCPSCNRKLRSVENIPVLSYLFLRGRCAGCKSPISIRYPVVELVTAGASLVLWLLVLEPAITQHVPAATLVVRGFQAAALLLLIPMSLIDFDHMILPDAFTIPGLIFGLALAFLPGDLTPVQSLIGVLVGGGTLLFFGKIGEWVFRKGETMGGGDIKLMAWVGALWGWDIALLAIILASFAGAIVGGALLVSKSLRRDHKLPFGPFLAMGIWAAVLAGTFLVQWYLGTTDSFLPAG